ncbi:MAG TPA: hypothetical protein VK459_10330, partial [Polyangiaceae bacterium]|nr:hypothetical protein [Polyangiaceae bacterium]
MEDLGHVKRGAALHHGVSNLPRQLDRLAKVIDGPLKVPVNHPDECPVGVGSAEVQPILGGSAQIDHIPEATPNFVDALQHHKAGRQQKSYDARLIVPCDPSGLCDLSQDLSRLLHFPSANAQAAVGQPQPALKLRIPEPLDQRPGLLNARRLLNVFLGEIQRRRLFEQQLSPPRFIAEPLGELPRRTQIIQTILSPVQSVANLPPPRQRPRPLRCVLLSNKLEGSRIKLVRPHMSMPRLRGVTERKICLDGLHARAARGCMACNPLVPLVLI